MSKQVTFDQDRVIVIPGGNSTIKVVFQGSVFVAVSSPVRIPITRPIVSHRYTGERPLRRIGHMLCTYNLETDEELPRTFMPVFAWTEHVTVCTFEGKIATLQVVENASKVITRLALNLERHYSRRNIGIPVTVLGTQSF